MKTRTRMIFISLILVFVLCQIIPSQAPAAEISLSYGEDTWSSSLCSEGVETHALELELKIPVKKWLDIGVVIDQVWSDTNPGHNIDGVYFSGRDISLILAARLTARKMVSEHIFVEGYGSLGWMTPNNHPEMGDSGIVGNFGGNIGYDFGRWSVIYGVGHWSDPARRHDKGHNRHYFGITREFDSDDGWLKSLVGWIQSLFK